MLENGSFDSVLGRLYPKSDKFDGLSGTDSNPDLAGAPILVNSSQGTSAEAMTTPDPNPGKSWRDINEQLFDSPEPPSPGQVPSMNGFVRIARGGRSPRIGTQPSASCTISRRSRFR